MEIYICIKKTHDWYCGKMRKAKPSWCHQYGGAYAEQSIWIWNVISVVSHRLDASMSRTMMLLSANTFSKKKKKRNNFIVWFNEYTSCRRAQVIKWDEMIKTKIFFFSFVLYLQWNFRCFVSVKLQWICGWMTVHVQHMLTIPTYG